MSNHALTYIFYKRLGPQDRYLLDTTRDDTFMSKYEDDAMELIEIVAENSHHNAAKPFTQGVTSRGQMIDAKSMETSIFLDRIKKMFDVRNLLLDHLNIRNGSRGLALVTLQDVRHHVLIAQGSIVLSCIV